jgi:hypothetical protein
MLPRNGNSEIDGMRLVVVVASGDPLADSLFAFGDALMSSTWLTTVGAEYGLTHVASTTSVHATGPAMPTLLDVRGLRQYVTDLATAQPSLAPDGHTIYVVFYPPATSYPSDCSDALGAHTTLAPMPAAGAPTDALAFARRCLLRPGDTELDALTEIASHEIAEALSDAAPPGGWSFPPPSSHLSSSGAPPWSISSWAFAQADGVENGDLCEGTRYREAGHAYQRIWSNAAASTGGDPCAPALPDAYFSASAPADWIEVPAGTTTLVPITGWTTAARDAWSVTVLATPWVGPFNASFGSSRTAMLTNGQTAMLAITAPMAPGQFAVLRLASSPGGPVATSGGVYDFPQPASGDAFHLSVFGVHTVCVGCADTRTCGDGRCDAPTMENCASCPTDCGACGNACEAGNFIAPCGSGYCPSNSTCVAGACVCDMGYTEATCDGAPCGASGCSYPNFWCVPTSCGTSNFVTTCGGGMCPADAQCAGTNRCSCLEGTHAARCDGQPCPSGGCAFPDYWCAVCGPRNETVPCGTTGCPSFSTCTASLSCMCMAGYHPEHCDGSPCMGDCNGSNWWCVPGAL